ncbi:MAG: hypothetical protein EBR94_01070 [Bacteroidetes bacterium]|nr:hypothetical protein [Bacteroidota bacterium]
MNRFILDIDPVISAQYHNDKHVVKMILEEAQMLSTAHRVLDGTPTVVFSSSGRKSTQYVLNSNMNDVFYKATHVNHPCNAWVRETSQNYQWGYSLFVSLLSEYTYRYGKIHATENIAWALKHQPRNIPSGPLTPFPQAMPDECKHSSDSVLAYQKYYVLHKNSIGHWTKRETPQFFLNAKDCNVI